MKIHTSSSLFAGADCIFQRWLCQYLSPTPLASHHRLALCFSPSWIHAGTCGISYLRSVVEVIFLWLLMLGNKRWHSFRPALSLSLWIHVWGLLSQQVKRPAPLKLSGWRDHVKNLLRDTESRSNTQLVQPFQTRYQTWTWKLLWWHQLQPLPGYSLKSDPKPELHTQLQFLTHRNSKRK